MSAELLPPAPADLPSSHLYYREGGSDKVYQAWIEVQEAGYAVNFAFGRRGSALSTGTKTSSPVAYEAAVKIYEKIVGEKKAKGYTPEASGQAFAMTDKAGRISGRLPQLLNPINDSQALTYLESEDWFLEEKFDGRRLMAAVLAGQVEGSNRKGLVVSLPQEVADALVGAGDCVLDGELVGTKFWVFDVLSLGGSDLTTLPFSERAARRDSLTFTDTDSAQAVTSYRSPAEKTAAYAAIRNAGREGVVFKRASAPYKVGRPTAGGDQVKVKFYATCSAVVAKVNAQRSVALKLGDVNVGNVTVPVNFALPAVGEVVEVRYLYANRGGALYQAIYLGTRDDVDPGECGLDQIKYKAEGAEQNEEDEADSRGLSKADR
ncbi:MAG: ATP-dependent DNA ligase [Cytophagales bacterium]|nr:ATP-dependent DNA ligase [Armatimonadota bacterium]